ncbi:hypothetical protein AgCh_009454 [Apium graveolens]
MSYNGENSHDSVYNADKDGREGFYGSRENKVRGSHGLQREATEDGYYKELKDERYKEVAESSEEALDLLGHARKEARASNPSAPTESPRLECGDDNILSSLRPQIPDDTVSKFIISINNVPLTKSLSVNTHTVKIETRDKARISGSRVTEFIPNIVEDEGSEIPMKKDSAKLEVILKEKCMCYNEDSSYPRVIRLVDGLERNHISSLRTAIYQIGSQGEELKQVKATLSQVLRNNEEKLISNFVKNHFGFRLTQ